MGFDAIIDIKNFMIDKVQIKDKKEIELSKILKVCDKFPIYYTFTSYNYANMQLIITRLIIANKNNQLHYLLYIFIDH